MTTSEHKLMVFMFTRQLMLIESLFEILTSRGILSADDGNAFEALVKAKEFSSPDAFHSVVNQYTEFARQLGLDGDLPHA